MSVSTNSVTQFRYQETIDQICGLRWDSLTTDECIDVAWAYYFFSIQFRESLGIACLLFPSDERLKRLDAEERNTDNLSPWPGVAAAGERMNHDEFMRRTLGLAPIAPDRQAALKGIGEHYLSYTRHVDPTIKAQSIASYEDGGLARVFNAMLRAPLGAGPLHRAFGHFLSEHVRFDSDPQQGHGALCRHIRPDDRIATLWTAFHDLFLECVPGLAG